MGCMPMTGDNYGDADEAEALRTLNLALDMGVNFWDTSETYGTDNSNEILLGKVISERRDEVIVATKFGLRHEQGSDFFSTEVFVNSRPEVIAPSCDASLRRLNVDYIDLYYQHRVDPDVPIEETWGAARELVLAGKVRHLGMTEPGLNTLRRAHAIHPVTAVQNEYSLFSRDVEGGVLDTLRELGIGLVCFAPLCRGFLTGSFTSPDDFSAGDLRRHLPRFQGENFYKNLELVDKIAELATGLGLSATQLALAWILHQGDDIVPIPGIETRDRLKENAVAAEVELSTDVLARIDSIFEDGAFGSRMLPGAAFTHYAETVELPA